MEGWRMYIKEFKTPREKFALFLFPLGLILSIVGIFTPNSWDLAMLGIILACELPMLIISRRKLNRSKERLFESKTKVIVIETIMEMFDPEGFEALKKRREAQAEVAKLFGGKHGRKRADS